ncbi:MAG: hypothetical protein SCG73_02735 [Nitrospiraceae bacterium]|nr:hypothetical protein [Nitrospiraceae bacterium]MDW7654955.1 hypothetical protein [Nitrospiraceae bacterium]
MRALRSHSILRSVSLVLALLTVPAGAAWSAVVAGYGLTTPCALEAMIAAKKRGADARQRTDLQRTEADKQRAAFQTRHLVGIPILTNAHDGLMPLKPRVSDDEINASGSMTHTMSGSHSSDTRLDVRTDDAISGKARKVLALWNAHGRYWA